MRLITTFLDRLATSLLSPEGRARIVASAPVARVSVYPRESALLQVEDRLWTGDMEQQPRDVALLGAKRHLLSRMARGLEESGAVVWTTERSGHHTVVRASLRVVKGG